ncbi:hypothetical protein GWL_42200 [Herbaspirillum sp. GW103]|nr:hypothetical protein GWL_42200 [Herbaspirillum sp. GW103]
MAAGTELKCAARTPRGPISPGTRSHAQTKKSPTAAGDNPQESGCQLRACSHSICECERSPSVVCLGAATRRGGATARSCNNGRRRLAASPGGLPPEGALAALHVRAGGTTTSPDARLATTPSGGKASHRLNVNRP